MRDINKVLLCTVLSLYSRKKERYECKVKVQDEKIRKQGYECF